MKPKKLFSSKNLLTLTIVLAIISLSLFSIKIFPSVNAATRDAIQSINPNQLLEQVVAEKGILDLRAKNIRVDGPFTLDGEWEFYWDQLLFPEDLQADGKQHILDKRTDIVIVPSNWSKYSIDGESLPNEGYATYRLKLYVSASEIGKVGSLYIPSVATAYTIWVDDVELISNGIVGKTREEMLPKELSQVASFPIQSEMIEIVIHVSDFYQRKSGLWESITFGTSEHILAVREHNIIFQTFIIGSIFIIGMYHVVLFFLRRKEFSPLFFALACFGIGIRASLLSDNLFVYFIRDCGWDAAVKTEYLAGVFGLIFFLLFKQLECMVDIPKIIVKILVGCLIVYGIFVLVTPTYVFTTTVYVMFALAFLVMSTTLIVTIIRLLRGREGAYLNFLGVLVLFAAVLNDIFYYGQWISTDELVSLGLFFYIFVQAVNLSRRFSKSFDKVERLSVDLQELNFSLEQKVHQRTQQLQKANDNLIKMEQARGKLFASVSHELNTPLTFIQGYIKAMIDGVIDKEDSKYLRSIYSDTQLMAHIIKDLQELSKLESGHVKFSYQRIEMLTFFRQLYDKQKPIVEKKGLVFHYHENVTRQDGLSEVMGNIDPKRIEQVFMNLVINAKKYTQAGGIISIETSIVTIDENHYLKLGVIDNGPGIPEKDLPYIFNRFYKVQTQEDSEIRGAGLGLAIVKEIIENHGGTIGVESVLGEGSRFYFMLPFQFVQVEYLEGIS
ncbi:hypothetical protein BHU72_05745 [Desulfuribacillus stibiiarsenatis]|uniref:histidine kinase n=1 Tax=Desulfuribacillus stibiiarsenatis TaxID=1390249 RepID=A0A1E5L526_9FIRM|nr:ATP-binding protein [Desulfuribacillus stibiiarsenatis]OEH85113.1 hypothetical protein BHU72_05745 [Desulfuribacillus stibiiarsenatis]